jgi:hypothetical protein
MLLWSILHLSALAKKLKWFAIVGTNACVLVRGVDSANKGWSTAVRKTEMHVNVLTMPLTKLYMLQNVTKEAN